MTRNGAVSAQASNGGRGLSMASMIIIYAVNTEQSLGMGLSLWAYAAERWFSISRTSIWPVTAAEMRAVRRSRRRSMAR